MVLWLYDEEEGGGLQVNVVVVASDYKPNRAIW
jgi:hypothetical protein